MLHGEREALTKASSTATSVSRLFWWINYVRIDRVRTVQADRNVHVPGRHVMNFVKN